jgi:hypothetical protein
MMPIPLFGDPVQQYIEVNAIYWHVADNDNYRLNLITNTNLSESSTLVSSSNPNYSTTGGRRRMQAAANAGESGSRNYQMFETPTMNDSGITVFQVKQNPANTNSYYNSALTVSEFQLLNSYTNSGSVRGLRILNPSTSVSRFQFEYRTAPMPSSSNIAQTIDIKLPSSANYVPSSNSIYIDVISIGKTSNYPTVYATRNGRGSSGSPYHLSGSFISVGGGSLFAGFSSYRPVYVQGDNPLDASFPKQLNLYECIVFNGALIQSDIDLIETYLRNKWNISY